MILKKCWRVYNCGVLCEINRKVLSWSGGKCNQNKFILYFHFPGFALDFVEYLF